MLRAACGLAAFVAVQGPDPGLASHPADAVAADAGGNLYLTGPVKPAGLAVKNAHQPLPGESRFLKSDDGAPPGCVRNPLLRPAHCAGRRPRSPGLLCAGGLEGLSRRTNGGRTWRLVLHSPMPSYPGVVRIAFDPAAPPRVYAPARAGGLLRSGDHGETWVIAPAWLPPTMLDRIAADPHKPGTVAARRPPPPGARSASAGRLPPTGLS